MVARARAADAAGRAGTRFCAGELLCGEAVVRSAGRTRASRRSRAPAWVAVVALLGALVAGACTDDQTSSAPQPPATGSVPEGSRYEARIRYTSHHIPHIEADDLGSLAFGQGWAQAEAHACTIAEQVLTVRAERARFLGPGDGSANVDADVGALVLGVHARASERHLALDEASRDVVDGFAAGFNAWLDEVGVDAVPGPCAGAEWVRPITGVDVLARLDDLALAAGGGAVVHHLGATQPPSAPAELIDPRPADEAVPVPELVPAEVGGAGWALGGQATGSGRPVLATALAAPWDGDLRLWEQHLVVPGSLDAYGVSHIGSPTLFAGFTDSLAWTATVAAGARLLLVETALDPSDPTRYLVGGASEAMIPEERAVEVRQPDGTIELVRRTTWSTRYGPVVDLPGLGWDATRAVSAVDLVHHGRPVALGLATAGATTLDELEAALVAHGPAAWSDVLAVSVDGEAWYANGAATPALAPEVAAAWDARVAADPTAAAWAEQGAVVIDADALEAAAGAEVGGWEPALVPLSEAPVRRTEGLLVAGDHSHWIVDPAEPLLGFPSVLGAERVPPSPTSRRSLVAATTLVADAAADGRPLERGDVAVALLDEESVSGDLLVDEVVDRCRLVEVVRVPERRDGDELVWASQEVRLDPACDALADWDRTFELEARGAVLWREALVRLDPASLTDAGELFAEAFDPDDPLATPRGLAEPPAPVLVALGEALLTLDEVGVAPDVALRDVQEAVRGVDRLPMHGGHAADGALVVVGGTDEGAGAPVPGSALTEGGYLVSRGTAWVLVVELTDDGPRAEAILAHGQSGDPASPHYADQTYRFSDKAWRPARFGDDAIADDPALVEVVVGAARSAG